LRGLLRLRPFDERASPHRRSIRKGGRGTSSPRDCALTA